MTYNYMGTNYGYAVGFNHSDRADTLVAVINQTSTSTIANEIFYGQYSLSTNYFTTLPGSKTVYGKYYAYGVSQDVFAENYAYGRYYDMTNTRHINIAYKFQMGKDNGKKNYDTEDTMDLWLLDLGG